MLTMAPDAPTAIDSDLARWLERSEALAFARLTAAAERTPGNPAGASRLEIGGGVAVASEVSKDIILFDRALGFGFDEPLTEETVEAVAAFFRDRGRPRSSIQLAPAVATPEAVGCLRDRGYVPGRRWVKLWHDLRTLPVMRSSLRVERIDAARADDFVAIGLEVFELASSLDPFLRAVIGRPGWSHYLAFDADRPVATAAMSVFDDVAWFGFGATLEEARGRGGQSALFTARLRDAADLGCRWAVVETGEETEEFPVNHSYRNMVRAGFHLAYARQNYNRVVDLG
jgi:GNAT superfamily N-acetyltransferase